MVVQELNVDVSSALDGMFAPFNRSDVPGLVVGIAQHGKRLYRRGFGLASLEHAVANTPGTRMRIGSVSKHFTALLTLLLVEEGKFDLDAPIRSYIPELTGPGGDPTVRQLLLHRGGSRCYLDIGVLCRGLAPAPLGSALAKQVRQTGRNFAPGDSMIYNNGGYQLVSIAIERVGGASFEAQLKQRLFDPLGMLDTESIPSDYSITPGVATMHVPAPGGGWRRGLFPSEENRGEGAIVSTVDDMLRWTEHLRTQDRFGSPATWAALTELAPFPDGTAASYGLGVMVQTYRGVRIVHHAGGVTGGSSQMLTAPDHGLDIVIIANGAPACSPVKLAEQALDLILADHLGERAPTIAAADYKDLLGDWWSADTGMIYGLVDDAGVLGLSVCSSSIGFPLEKGPDGRVLARGVGAGMGDFEIGLEEAVRGDGLMVRFGGQSAVYQRVSRDTANAEAFVEAVTGQYYSADADCTAVIARDGERIVLRCGDAYGQRESELVCLGETLACISPPLMGWSAALSFSKQGGRMSGFQFNSGRTRNLSFERKQTG
ncbi:beta-lactamase family protein [Paraburkholderia sp. RP-4-7]|uniref:Beta-lactamase family protein n=1 Tax=Paraburkholderia polaris TaxID=2728848 RepID=A0A848IBX7_9BURK|nr:serine hydrolase domain-containing protein [Paraburkholderia polaris]NML99080.1 beta-lactamase family protein [Paraburkholderia polaris]